ncbi:class I SAM-dependent methyltransferase [Agrobacterium sp. O3.4]|uniref:S-adenosyl-L-methionine methyltransferase n=2 Tax=Rhizobium/Agrobacterium group TaxID=227290 RepID=A0A546XDJ6_RHIRH|nr:MULTISPECIES: class I SAM-dependent methyltransferase [Rhizobium/Agrobacterium group]MCZ7470958.1 hypothetical protein [Rhizobium rhizogenes]MDO3442940.1 class I SAM-dependent methyltransferase [Agrobacterium sp. V1]TRA98832.1 hypothetical protein EXN68_19050 [Rhizobium rhizogenes]WHO07704.1 class I SAM-dependent methyltransferase [Agrobacterium cucumeris]
MSRLDSFIRRLTAQRDILNHLAADLDLPEEGALMEIGLGNGRTFNHLHELFPSRRIIAFDRAMGAHASSVPAPEDLVIGEISETAPAFIGADAAMVHADIGTGYPEKDAVTLTWLPDLAAGVLAKGGIAVSGLPLEHPLLNPLPVPESVPRDRYFLYRKI